MSKILLVVEDEQDLAEILEYNFKQEGYIVRIANDGAQALQQAAKSPPPDLALLDLMLPDMSGVEICRRFRADERLCNMSIVMVTAKGEEIDRVIGFEVGADDYVVKPFSARELALRVRAILRRSEQQSTNDTKNAITFGPFHIDLGAHRAWTNNEELSLTALEFRLLITLIERRGLVQTREKLLEDVWNMDPNMNTRTVDKHVQRLRQKLGTAADYIDTIRGVGYRFKSVE